VDLNDTLKQFEAVEANLAKLERLWNQIKALLPTGSEVEVSDEDQYRSLQRSFAHITSGMPKIDGFALEGCLLDSDAIIQGNVDCLELGEFSASLSFSSAIFRQGEVLNDYRFRMESKRRELARQAVDSICGSIEDALRQLKTSAELRKENAQMPEEEWRVLASLFKSIDALLGKSVSRPPRWAAMDRHLSFGCRGDYDDIVRLDWPSIRQWLDKALYGESDPLPVAATDLGDLVRANPKGPVSTELGWSALSPTEFERLVFNLIDRTRGYVNPQWLTDTNAPDRGRDLSVERVSEDHLTGSRRHRIILACKHVSSVNLRVVTELKEQMRLWEPPRVDELIVVTTGRFTTDAIAYVEKHNGGSEAMRIELWAGSHLERLLAHRPELIAEFGLRP
jgi:hypothetical protein